LESAKSLLADATQARTIAENERTHAEAELEQLQRFREEKSIDLQKLRASLFKQALEKEDYKDLREALEKLGQQTGLLQGIETAEDLQDVLKEFRTLQGRTQATFLTLINAPDRGVRIALLLGILVLVPLLPTGINYLASQRGVGNILGSAGVTITQITTFIIGITSWLGTLLQKTSKLVSRLESTKSQVDEIVKNSRAEPTQAERQLLKEISGLKEREETAKKSLSEAQQRLDRAQLEINALLNIQDGRRLAQFVQERISQEDYRKRLGIVSTIRRDLQSLSDLLANSSIATDDEGEKLPRIDRIILYIDDLDRCPEERVVEVLQAIHLLLAFKLFVVVVGVDSRWLLHSLEKAYPALQGKNDQQAGLLDEEKLAWETNPQNYLEKIFQIPYNLQGMDKNSFGNLVDSLLTPQSENLPGSTQPAQTSLDGSTSDLASPAGSNGPDSTSARILTLPAGQFAQGLAGSKTGENGENDEDFEQDDQTPRLLVVENSEKEFITLLYPMMPTPRATKRFINIYRLIRAKLKSAEMATFLNDSQQPGEYQAVMILLGILTGFQRVAPHVFRKIMASGNTTTWKNIIDALLPRRRLGETEESYYNGLLPSMSKAEAAEWQRLYLALNELQDQQKIGMQISTYRKWVPSVVKFSFRLGKAFSYISMPPEIRIVHLELGLENKNNEFATIENFGDIDQDLSGWILRDQAQHAYHFPAFTLSAHNKVNVWVRTGKNTDTDLYWGRKTAIWNNAGDAAYLQDVAGNIISNFTVEKA
jgi:hypothetical protein